MEMPAKFSPESAGNILIVRMGGMGDVVCSTPVIRNMRRSFPDAHIAFLTREEHAPVLEGSPHLNEIMVVPQKKKVHSFLRKQKTELQFLRGVRKKKFDVVLNLSGGPRAALITLVSGAPVRVGFTGERKIEEHAIEKESKNTKWKSNRWRDFRSRAYNVPLPTRWPLYVPELLLDSVRALGIAPDDAHLELFLSDDDEKYACGFFTRNGIAEGQTVVCMNPGGLHASKRWPDDYYAELADRLDAQTGAKIILVKPGNYDVGNIVKNMKCKSAVAENLPLKKAAAVIRKCSLFVSNDSGLKFVAVAMNVPTVTFFGSRGHVGATPPESQNHLAFYKELPCRPCYQSECPLGTLDCLKQITPEEVMGIIRAKFFDKIKTSAYV